MHPALQSEISGTTSISAASQLDALLHAAAIAPLIDRAFLRITGPDAQRWLNGMVTNDIQSLQPGEGNYSFLLNAQGRILGDCTVYREPDSTALAFLLETGKSQLDAIQQHLDKFIIMDDVELQPAASNLSGLLILGPGAPAILRDYYRSFHTEDHSAMTPLRLAFDSENGDQITTPSAALVPQFEIWKSTATADSLMQYTLAAGAVPVSPSALEQLRILSGTPLYGTDIRNTAAAHELPQETAPIGVQSRALHFTKGCYLGQEIVERIHSRGNVHRTFAGFQLTGALPTPGTVLTADSDSDSDSDSNAKPVGELTSVAAIPLPTGPVQLALGYIRRQALPVAALDRNLPFQYPGGTATPIALPYRTLLNPASQTRI
jgi:folate-binding protein YgfZ